MLFVLLAISISYETDLYHFCNHDEIQSQINVRMISLGKTKNKRSLSNERKPIRIHLDFRIDNDDRQCTEPGQQVVWRLKRYTCTEKDIFNETQKIALQKTMENVRDYLQGILLVDPVDEPFPIESENWVYFNLTNAPGLVSDCDIYLSVFIRTYGASLTLASAMHVTEDEFTHRPLQGAVFVNSRYLPEEVQNEHSTNTQFFYTVIHEIFHALGVSSSSFPYYHPRDSNVPFENPLVVLNDTNTGKKHNFLVTLYAHKFAVMQWGVENFTINGVTVPSGIEIEDGGGRGTAGSHPEGRIANQDLMVGVNIQGENGPYLRLTPLTAAILLDTGNYDIVWSKVQPLVWGNKDSIDGNYIKDFVIGPPAYVFPQNYIYRPSSDPSYNQCGFTFKMIGGYNSFLISNNPAFNCSLDEWKNYSDTSAYCEAEKFFNPNGDDEVGGNWPYDFQIVHFPSQEICGVGNACISGMDECSPYKIAEDRKSFTITINGFDLECNKTNENKTITQVGNYIYHNGIKCPPVEQFIRTVKMMEEQQYLTGDPFVDEVQTPEQTPVETPTQTPTKTPTQTPTKTPTQTPVETPTQTPEKTPTQTPVETPTQTPEKTPIQTPVETPTSVPTKEPTSVPTKEPTSVPTKEPTSVPTKEPTSVPTKEPTAIPIIYNETNSENRERLKVNVTKENEKNVVVLIIQVTKFSNYVEKNEDGGAIYLHNCGIDIEKIEFESCQSESGGGGAIYIKNKLSLDNTVSLDNLQFNECKAVYGGAIFIYSSINENLITISKCIFTKNQVTKMDSKDDPFSGGSSIYINVKKSLMKRCKFIGGSHGSSVKITNLFDDDDIDKISELNEKVDENKILIIECDFEQNKELLSSIYYHGGKSDKIVKIKNCGFKGKLAKDSHYIDGFLASKDSPKLYVQSCKFDNNWKQMASKDLIIFSEVSTFKSLRSLNIVIICSLVAVFAFLLLIITIFKSNRKQSNICDENLIL